MVRGFAAGRKVASVANRKRGGHDSIDNRISEGAPWGEVVAAFRPLKRGRSAPSSNEQAIPRAPRGSGKLGWSSSAGALVPSKPDGAIRSSHIQSDESAPFLVLVSVFMRPVSVFMRLMSVFMRPVSVFMRPVSVFMRFVSVFMRFVSVFMRLVSVFMRLVTVFMRLVSVFTRPVNTFTRVVNSVSEHGDARLHARFFDPGPDDDERSASTTLRARRPTHLTLDPMPLSNPDYPLHARAEAGRCFPRASLPHTQRGG